MTTKFDEFLAELQQEKEAPTLDHYSADGDFYCRGCHSISSHFLLGIKGVTRRRPRLIPQSREVAYMCRSCKELAEYRYCPPNQKLEFKEIRNK